MQPQQISAVQPVVRLEVSGRLTRITLELRDLPRDRREDAVRTVQGLAAHLQHQLAGGALRST